MGEKEGDQVGLWRFSLPSAAAIATTVSLFSAAARREERSGGGERGGEKGLNRVGGGGGNNGNKPAVIEDMGGEKTVCRPLGGGKEKVGDKYKPHSFLGGKEPNFRVSLGQKIETIPYFCDDGAGSARVPEEREKAILFCCPGRKAGKGGGGGGGRFARGPQPIK